MTPVLTLVAGLITLHMGALHPAEKGLTLALAFGPFVLLAVVILVRRRQDRALDRAERDGEVERQA
jgi:hypothetical protein